ncbi:unnamed protein product [Heligmosomoides polygyrus]|uniref:PPM-type phosphatase domain-containing protein n=1 Tax=Heligmosomoides polygyrus TaxID=6339 RepID=A0A183F6H9_HELPZ|nr:unnamed protein product [Heligmosomoides polygyrus]
MVLNAPRDSATASTGAALAKPGECGNCARRASGSLEAKKAANKAVFVARATHYDDVNEKLGSDDGERFLYRHAKVRHRQAEDVEKVFGISDENGLLLMDRRMVLN